VFYREYNLDSKKIAYPMVIRLEGVVIDNMVIELKGG